MFSTNYRVPGQVDKLTSVLNELIFYSVDDKSDNMVMMIHVYSELSADHSDRYFS